MSLPVLPDGWKRPRGYSNGILAEGRMLFIAGQIGWNANEEFETDDFAAQTAQALKNIVAVMQAAGSKPEHLVRMTWYVTDKSLYLAALKEIGSAYKEIIGPVYPAMSAVEVNALIEDRALVEIECTAVVPTR